MAQLPAWRLIDPLPILAQLDIDEDEDEDDSLESLVGEHEETSTSPDDREPSSNEDKLLDGSCTNEILVG